MSLSAKAHVYFVSSYHKAVEEKRDMFPYLISKFDYNGKKTVLYLNSKRLSEIESRKNADVFYSQIKKDMPSLVFLSDDNALKFLGERIIKLGIKVVCLGINENPRKYMSSRSLKQLYGVLERPLYIRGIIEINGMLRDLKKATILLDNSMTSKTVIDSIFKKRKSVVFKKIKVNYIVVKTQGELASQLPNIEQSDSHLFLGPIHRIKKTVSSNDYLEYYDLLKFVTNNYKKEYYSFWKDYVVDDGAILAYGVDMNLQAKVAIETAQKLLRGKKPSQRFFTPDRGETFISERQIIKRKMSIK